MSTLRCPASLGASTARAETWLPPRRFQFQFIPTGHVQRAARDGIRGAARGFGGAARSDAGRAEPSRAQSTAAARGFGAPLARTAAGPSPAGPTPAQGGTGHAQPRVPAPAGRPAGPAPPPPGLARPRAGLGLRLHPPARLCRGRGARQLPTCGRRRACPCRSGSCSRKRSRTAPSFWPSSLPVRPGGR